MKLAFFYLIALKFNFPKSKEPAMKYTACYRQMPRKKMEKATITLSARTAGGLPSFA
jgi:hypothetical protein